MTASSKVDTLLVSNVIAANYAPVVRDILTRAPSLLGAVCSVVSSLSRTGRTELQMQCMQAR